MLVNFFLFAIHHTYLCFYDSSVNFSMLLRFFILLSGCVRMKYISQSEGILVNVSYGESLLHSEQVKGPNPEPTCMSLLTNLAQVCARFSTLEPHEEGLRGCMALEPKLLGDVTAHFPVGCFTMGNEGMKLEPGNSTYAGLLENQIGGANSTQ